MSNDKEEIVYGDKTVAKNLLLFILLYVLFLLWLEPLIDWLLSARGPDMDLAAIQQFNQRKVYVSTVAFGVARSFPILFFLWFGYVSMLSGRLPPKNMRMPFTVRVIKGKNAMAMGMLIIAVSLLLLFRELSLLLQVHPV
jgi:hypothetical protein